MKSFLVGIAVLMLSVAGIAATFAASNARAVQIAAPSAWFKRYGALIAAAVLVIESLFAVHLLGIMAGVFVVLSAWMIGGLFFIYAVNAWPVMSMRFALIGGGVGVVGAALTTLIS